MADLGHVQPKPAHHVAQSGVIFIDEVVVIALHQEVTSFFSDDPVHHDPDVRRAVPNDLTDLVWTGGTEDCKVAGVKAGLHADARSDNVDRVASQAGRREVEPEQPSRHQPNSTQGCPSPGPSSLH